MLDGCVQNPSFSKITACKQLLPRILQRSRVSGDGEGPPPTLDMSASAGGPPSRQAAPGQRSLEENVVDKLKLLGYELEFCRSKHRLKPLSRVYFALPAPLNSQNEQFFYFTSLVAWLLGLCGRPFQPPQQYDDPNVTCAAILSELREAGFAPPPWGASKLRQAHGEAACGVLDALCDAALQQQGFTFNAPIHSQDTVLEEAEVDEYAEVTAEVDEEAAAAQASDEEESYAAMVAGPFAASPQQAAQQPAAAEHETEVDPEEWRLEVERVAPRLRLAAPHDARDWRVHLEQAHQHGAAMDRLWPEGQAALRKVLAEVTSSLDKLATRERFLYVQCEGLAGDYRVARERLGGLQAQFAAGQDAAADMDAELAQMTKELEDCKQQLEDRGSSISDTSSIVRTKAAIKQLHAELQQMRVRTGVLEHQLLQISLKQNSPLHAGPASAAADRQLQYVPPYAR